MSRLPNFMGGLAPYAAILLLLLIGWAETSHVTPRYDSDSWRAEAIQQDNERYDAQVSHVFEPDPQLTPGEIFPDVTVVMLCESGYSARVRHVTEHDHQFVFALYGLNYDEDHADYEDDHLVPLCLGGTNSPKNHWPQKYSGEWNARVKDNLERWALAEVRAGRLGLREAQHGFAHGWVAFYRDHLGHTPRAATNMKDEEQ